MRVETLPNIPDTKTELDRIEDTVSVDAFPGGVAYNEQMGHEVSISENRVDRFGMRLLGVFVHFRVTTMSLQGLSHLSCVHRLKTVPENNPTRTSNQAEMDSFATNVCEKLSVLLVVPNQLSDIGRTRR